MRSHLLIPDTQVKEGVPLDHIEALGHFIVDKKPDVIIHIGDHWDMASLSSFEKAGSKFFENKSYRQDVDSGNEAMRLLLRPMREHNDKIKHQKGKQYKPEMHFLMGNHEYRINRCVHEKPILEGTIGTFDLDTFGWQVHPFLDMVNVDGVNYAHYFINPHSLTKSVLGGMILTKLKNLGFSFTMGHQQILQIGRLDRSDGTSIQGLTAGSFYMHDEDYMNSQGNQSHWRGFVWKDGVENGEYDLTTWSIDRLLREYG